MLYKAQQYGLRCATHAPYSRLRPCGAPVDHMPFSSSQQPNEPQFTVESQVPRKVLGFFLVGRWGRLTELRGL